MVTQLCDYNKSHWIVHFKWMDCMESELYLNIIVTKNNGHSDGYHGIITTLQNSKQESLERKETGFLKILIFHQSQS